MPVLSVSGTWFHWSFCALCLAQFVLPAARAGENTSTAFEAIRVSGFATLGLTHSDNADAGVIFSYSQKRPVFKGLSANLDSLLGVQLDWRASPDTTLLFQAVARAGNDLKPEVRMAYVRQQIGQGIALRAGRIRSPMYFDSDVAEIGYAYLMARPPIPLYTTVNSSAAIDGADLQWRHSVGNTAFLLQGYYGGYRYKRNLFAYGSSADIKLSNMRGVALSVSLPNLTARVSRTWIGSYTLRSSTVDLMNAGLGQMSASLRRLAANPALPEESQARLSSLAEQVTGFSDPLDGALGYCSAGFDGNIDDWRFLGEWTRIRSQKALAGNYRGYQLTAGYNLHEFTPYVSIARQDRRNALLDTSALAVSGVTANIDRGFVLIKGAFDRGARFFNLSTRSASLGVRYDFQEDRALKLQYDRLKTPNSMTPGSFAVTGLPINNRINLFSATLDMVF